MLGIMIEESHFMAGDNMSVILNTTLPSSVLKKKKHQACNYHQIREAIAGGIIIFGHIDTKDNVADICTKPLPGPQFAKLVGEYLFRKPNSLVYIKKAVMFMKSGEVRVIEGE
jgi:hypothetical protein